MELYKEERDGITMIAVQGDIDGSTAGEMRDYLVPAIVPNCRILLEVSQVSYMSSAGLRVMTLIYRQTKEQNGALVLVGVTSDIRAAMDATGFLKHFTLVETVQEGLEALAVS
jgi:anti-sigma B factor antagonist